MIAFNEIDHGYAIAEAAGTFFNPAADACIAREEDDELVGGVIYQNYTGTSCGLHLAGFRHDWVNKDMLWVCFHYPFIQLNCTKIFGQVPLSNKRALEFDLKIGFKEETRISGVFDDGDLVVISMLREDCKWLKLGPRKLRLKGFD